MCNVKRLVLFGTLFLAGCGGGPVNAPPSDAGTAEAEVKAILQLAVSYGKITEGFSEIDQYVQEVEAKDAAKGQMLQTEIKALRALSDPEAIKAKAQEIIGKL